MTRMQWFPRGIFIFATCLKVIVSTDDIIELPDKSNINNSQETKEGNGPLDAKDFSNYYGSNYDPRLRGGIQYGAGGNVYQYQQPWPQNSPQVDPWPIDTQAGGGSWQGSPEQPGTWSGAEPYPPSNWYPDNQANYQQQPGQDIQVIPAEWSDVAVPENYPYYSDQDYPGIAQPVPQQVPPAVPNPVYGPINEGWDSWQQPGYGSDDYPCPEDYPTPEDCMPEPDLVPVCEITVCNESCKKYLGDDAEGACFQNECYCRRVEVEVEEEDWSYPKQDEWPTTYPECGKKPQSPINIKSVDVRELTRKVLFKNYDAPIQFAIENHGKGVRMFVQAHLVPSVTITDLTVGESTRNWRGNFTLAFIDLHWATTEHAVEGIKRNMEAQLHHYNPWFDSYEEAVQHQGETLAIALQFKEHGTDSTLEAAFYEQLKEIVQPDMAGVLTASKHHYLKPIPGAIGTSFGAYLGSQTHPPCQRGVHWLIPTNELKVTSDTMMKLQLLQDKAGKEILQNVRDLQEH